MKRVLLLNNVPAPYFTPLFEQIGAQSGWDLTVCYSSDWNQDVGWQAKLAQPVKSHRIIILDRQNYRLRRLLGSSITAAICLLLILLRDRPDYLICYGYTLKPQMVALLWAIITRTPFAVSGDSNVYTDSVVGMKRLFKNLWLREVTKSAAALIAVGTASQMFWESYGAHPKRLFKAGFAVDNAFYAQAGADRKEEATNLRHQIGLNGKVVFLFVGRLIQRKNVDLIIQAQIQLACDKSAVVIAGSGEQAEALKKIAGDHPDICFVGNVVPQDLPLYYAMSDVLILPASQEPWGLVVNEAMACGLAVIAHRDCGAAVDLVDEKNGVKLEKFSINEVARAMQRLTDDKSLLRSMQQNSLEKIKHWSIEAAAQEIIRAVEASS